MLVRHAQASFGAENYDALSMHGHAQSRLLGSYFKRTGWMPDRVITGNLQRQRETYAGLSLAPNVQAETHAGFNEYDFSDLLAVRFAGEVPPDVKADRKTHFRTLRETVLAWQQGTLKGVAETYDGFCARTAAALDFATNTSAKRVLVISSGGVIGQLIAANLEAPPRMMMELNLQIKNTSLSQFVFSGKRRFLHQFNATPHFDDAPDMLTYS